MQSKIKIVSSLEKVFPKNNIDSFNELKTFSMFKNEKKSFQILFSSVKAEKIKISVKSEIKDFCKSFYVKLIPCNLAAPKKSDDYYIKKDGGLFPDLLSPIENDSFFVEQDGLNSVWIEINGNSKLLDNGIKEIEIMLSSEKGNISSTIKIDVINALLPKQDLIFTNWFHTDCLMSYYKFDAFSDEYWETTENFLKRASEYGMNCVLTPIFTPPLDTEIGKERPTVQLVRVKSDGNGKYSFDFDLLDKWIKMSKRCNIEYFEISHLFTQWGAKHAPKIIAELNGKETKIFGWETKATSKEYYNFLKQFSQSFCYYIDSNNLGNKIFIHVSDEPTFSMLSSYKKASKIVHKLFGNYKIIDAMSSYPLSKLCKMKYPIPADNMIEPFIGKVNELWTYYCCCQADKNVSNRFFSMPSERNRVLGYQMYKYNVIGFLHWGFNFYYSQYSKSLIDPYRITDAGGAFSSGDSFVVYPDKNGTPLNSLRLNVFYDGFQDLNALKLLEKLTDKENAMRILDESTDIPLTFSNYPHSKEWLLETREKINSEIKKNI